MSNVSLDRHQGELETPPSPSSLANGRSSSSLPCPPRIKVFLALPLERFFVEETPEQQLCYLVPSNYDVLCSPNQPNQWFFHSIGNRRFRILIEMNVARYEQCYLRARLVSQNDLPSA